MLFSAVSHLLLKSGGMCRDIGGQYFSGQFLTEQSRHLYSHLPSSQHASSSICMKSLVLISRIQLSFCSFSKQMETSVPLFPAPVPSGFIAATSCSVKLTFTNLF